MDLWKSMSVTHVTHLGDKSPKNKKTLHINIYFAGKKSNCYPELLETPVEKSVLYNKYSSSFGGGENGR